MRRRAFIKLLGGATAAWPVATHAQQPAVPVVGFLNHGLPDERVRGLRQGLGEVGYIEGRNVAIEFRWANNEISRLPELVSDLIHRRVAVIAAALSTPAALAAKAATTIIPIVFGVGGDPVAEGLVASFNQPGGNITGIAMRNWELGGKRVGLLREVSPGVAPFAVLLNPDVPAVAEPFIKDVQDAASAIGRRIEVFYARSNREIDLAFASIVARQAGRGHNRSRRVAEQSQHPTRHLGKPPRLASNLSVARDGEDRRVDELWIGLYGCVSPGWQLCRSHSKGREGWRPGGSAADEV